MNNCRTCEGRFMKIARLCLMILMCCAYAVTAFASGNSKKIAVMPFTTGSVAKYGSAATYATGVMMTEISKNSDYTLLERENLDKLYAEQAMSKTGAVDDRSMIQTGMMLGADYMLFGSVDAKSKKSSGFGFLVSASSETTAIELTARIVDTRTGEVVASVEATGKKHSGNGINLSLAGLPETALLSNGLKINQQIDDATAGAVKDGVKRLMYQFNKERPLYGEVVKVTDKEIYINVGDNQGVFDDDKFLIITDEEVITDPDTGEVIQVIEHYGKKKLEVKKTNGNVSICKGIKNVALKTRVKRIIAD